MNKPCRNILKFGQCTTPNCQFNHDAQQPRPQGQDKPQFNNQRRNDNFRANNNQDKPQFVPRPFEQNRNNQNNQNNFNQNNFERKPQDNPNYNNNNFQEGLMKDRILIDKIIDMMIDKTIDNYKQRNYKYEGKLNVNIPFDDITKQQTQQILSIIPEQRIGSDYIFGTVGKNQITLYPTVGGDSFINVTKKIDFRPDVPEDLERAWLQTYFTYKEFLLMIVVTKSEQKKRSLLIYLDILSDPHSYWIIKDISIGQVLLAKINVTQTILYVCCLDGIRTFTFNPGPILRDFYPLDQLNVCLDTIMDEQTCILVGTKTGVLALFMNNHFQILDQFEGGNIIQLVNDSENRRIFILVQTKISLVFQLHYNFQLKGPVYKTEYQINCLTSVKDYEGNKFLILGTSNGYIEYIKEDEEFKYITKFPQVTIREPQQVRCLHMLNLTNVNAVTERFLVVIRDSGFLYNFEIFRLIPDYKQQK
ncbi:hypothetical protein pb186bvf_019143 [Paramecium bursaria]